VANYIETGNVSCSARDLQNIGKGDEAKRLDEHQLALVRRMRELQGKKIEIKN
jgi:hypothetical protein